MDFLFTLLIFLALTGVFALLGLNVWVRVPDEAATARGLLARGWCVRAGARYRLRSPPAIRITIAELMPDRAEQLADALHDVLSTAVAGRAP